jgi:hypothetical protein
MVGLLSIRNKWLFEGESEPTREKESHKQHIKSEKFLGEVRLKNCPGLGFFFFLSFFLYVSYQGYNHQHLADYTYHC